MRGTGHRRVLIADDSPAMRSWVRAAIAPIAGVVEEAASGFELLHHLGEGPPFDLIIASARLRGPGGAQALAIARTAGADTPFVLVAPFSKDSIRALVRRMARAALVEDALDANALLRACRQVLAPPAPMNCPPVAPPVAPVDLSDQPDNDELSDDSASADGGL
jgi:CheY-like chemotaxis protein